MQRIRVRYPNGFETDYNEDVATKLLRKRVVERIRKPVQEEEVVFAEGTPKKRSRSKKETESSKEE